MFPLSNYNSCFTACFVLLLQKTSNMKKLLAMTAVAACATGNLDIDVEVAVAVFFYEEFNDPNPFFEGLFTINLQGIQVAL